MNIHNEIEFLAVDAIRVRHFKSNNFLSVKLDDNLYEVFEWMNANNFEITPVDDADEPYYIDINEINKENIRNASVEKAMLKVPSEKIIRSDEPLINIFETLALNDWLFVVDSDKINGIVTKDNLASPAISLFIFTNLISLERGLRRLLGSFSNTQIPDAAPTQLEDDSDDPKYLSAVLKAVSNTPELLSALNFNKRSSFKKHAGRLMSLRNHIAHGRNILHIRPNSQKAIELIQDLNIFTKKTWELVENREQIWDVYLDTHVIFYDEHNKEIILSGPNADALPIEPSIHVITANNPFENVLSDSENQKRNSSLLNVLKNRELNIVEVDGASPDRMWIENSFAIHGLTRNEACEIAKKFGQRAIFEITNEEMLVVTTDSEIKAKRPRDLN